MKRNRNVALSNVVRRGFLGDIVEHVLRQTGWRIPHVAVVVGVGTGLAALRQNAPASIRARNVGGYIQNRSLSPRGGAVRAVGGRAGANCEDLVRARSVSREIGLEDLGVRVRRRAVANGGSHVVHPYGATNSELGDRAQCVEGG